MSIINPLPDKEYLLSILEYKNGELFWKIDKSKRIKIGNKAGTIKLSVDNYYSVTICINKIRYKAHNLIWKMFNGKDPIYEIDHIDHNSLNNNIENLIDTNENAKNKSKRKDNTSGIQGVDFDKNRNKWRVQIQNNNVKYMKRFDTKNEAELHALEKYKEFGFHENHGN